VSKLWKRIEFNTLCISFISYHNAINKQITNHAVFISVRSKPTETVDRNRLYNNTIERLIRIGIVHHATVGLQP